MDYENDILDLLNKMSSEMSSKFDGIHFEINSMKSTISTLNNKIQKNTDLLESLNKNIDSLINFQNSLSYKSTYSQINTDENAINSNYEDKLDSIKDTISNTSNTLSNINIVASSKLTSISQDLKFLTHKVLQAEKDLFNIQEDLKNNKDI